MSHTAATINALDSDAVFKLKADDILALGADAGNLSLHVLHTLGKTAFEAIDGAYFRPGKLNKLLKVTLGNLTPKQAASLSDETVKGLRIKTIEDMDKGVRKSIDVRLLSADQINEMSIWTFSEMDVSHVKDLSPTVIANLSGNKIASLIYSHAIPIPLDKLTAAQLDGFLENYSDDSTPEILAQLAKIKPEVSENVTTSTLLNLKADIAKALGFDTAALKELAAHIIPSEQVKLRSNALVAMPAEIRAELRGRHITYGQYWEIFGTLSSAAHHEYRANLADKKPDALAILEAKRYPSLLTPQQLAELDPRIVREFEVFMLNTMVTSELAIIAKHLTNEQLAKLDIRRAFELGRAGFVINTKRQGYVPMRRIAAFVGRRMPSARSAAKATA